LEDFGPSEAIMRFRDIERQMLDVRG
jgi:hypothetical protein